MWWWVSLSISLLLQGAPEGILERCKYVRVNGTRRVDLTPEIKEEILDLVRKYGTGKRRMVSGRGREGRVHLFELLVLCCSKQTLTPFLA